jgi:hypothetical protein
MVLDSPIEDFSILRSPIYWLGIPTYPEQIQHPNRETVSTDVVRIILASTLRCALQPSKFVESNRGCV